MADDISLKELQAMFSRTIRGEIEPRLRDLITPGGKLTTDEALNIHRDGYGARLTEALGETFEAVWWVLGDEDFFDTCAEFIEDHISESPNLSDYHPDFPAFVANKWIDSLPFIGDLAEFEWLFMKIFHMPEADGLEAEDFQELGAEPGSLKFEFTPSFHLVAFRHSIHEIWKQRDSDQEAAEFDWEGPPERMLLFRNAGDTFIYRLNEYEFAILSALEAGSPLGRTLERIETLENISELEEPLEEMIQRLFGLLVENRLIAGVVTE